MVAVYLWRISRNTRILKFIPFMLIPILLTDVLHASLRTNRLLRERPPRYLLFQMDGIKKRTPWPKVGTSLVVGMERFELTTSSSRTTRANLAALHPDEGMCLGVGVGVRGKNKKLMRIDIGNDEQSTELPVRS